jgi:dynein light intermediate chain 1
LEWEAKLSEEVLDFVQQAVRTVALEYGAGLFYTSSQRPDTIHELRSYLLYRLFQSAQVSSLVASTFRFLGKVQAIERDRILIPIGWDSVGKIKIVKDTFPCEEYLDPTKVVSTHLIADYAAVIQEPPAVTVT